MPATMEEKSQARGRRDRRRVPPDGSTQSRARAASSPRGERAFSLIEILIALMILGVLVTIAASSYSRYVERTRVAKAVSDIGAIAVTIQRYQDDNRSYPSSLADVRADQLLDPWGRPYNYYNLTTRRGNGTARKDKKLAPLNTDFDLYSSGKDGRSLAPLVTPVSRDDVVRARDGKFIGLASDFDP